jgi:hypothetical protein
MAGTPQHAIYLTQLDQLTGIHHRDAIAEPTNDPEIVADEQQGHTRFAPKARQQAQNLRLDGDVQRGRRLVEDQERGSASQRRGDQRALLHSTRELVGEGAGDLSRAIDPHLAQRDFAAGERLGQRQSKMLYHRFSDLPANAERRVERSERILKHGADASSENPPAPCRSETDEVLAFEPDRAGDFGVGAEKIQHCPGQTALTGPGLTHDGERAPRFEGKADIAHGGNLPVVFAIADRQVADLKERPALGGRRASDPAPHAGHHPPG